ncbi:hypothetical protein KUTeg_016323 [Tegillarca granosa]|uniref:Uncharacterized protein n=1 Tax=Tegillarca granosa TaxID=220873 RepID=A0ABQ9EKI6_TEGGR|nr:hypothetical protein KUTeg_016323 [Tegillarca granosa]
MRKYLIKLSLCKLNIDPWITLSRIFLVTGATDDSAGLEDTTNYITDNSHGVIRKESYEM